MSVYDKFKESFKRLALTDRHLIENTLSNIFTMRLIGNKTHGDMAEVGMTEFVNQFMDGYECKHVGKDKFRAKEHEEDVEITCLADGESIPVSLKAYGVGPLQLSTDKAAKMFPCLQSIIGTGNISGQKTIDEIFASDAFGELRRINVMPLIYDEKKQLCNILVFDYEKAVRQTHIISFLATGKGRKHPIYRFLDDRGHYICEVRYGGAAANALQRGFWTHTVNAAPYFDSLTGGWIKYAHNGHLVKNIRLALNATREGHEEANILLQGDIDRFKEEKR